ncbi:MAG: SdrD B-like domain-containing protein, partial [Christensenellales bacterium]|nr:SdrD B-like domain-containing protein [Christensenellales bacterium]
EIVTKVSIEQGDTIDFGQITICRAAQVSGRVRIDDDGDGVIDSSAQTLAGVRVTLLKAEDGHTDRVAETVTDESGCYHFDNLLAGTYSVLFKLDGDWAFTRFGEDSAVYGAVAQSGSTQSFELATGETIEQIDAGVTIPAQLTVNVFKDTQADGQKGTYEEGFEGIGITLIRLENGEDAESITYKTDAEGNVTFAGVSPGEYVIAYHLPGQWRATKNADASKTNYPVSSVPQSRASSGRSEPFTLTMGQSGVRMYIGAMLSGSVSGMVYYDDDADAGFGEEESYCMDVTIELLDSSDAVVAAIQPEEDGSYVFEGVAPGRYRVRFTAHEDDCAFSGTERSMAKGGVQPSTGGVSTTRSLTVTGGDALTEVNAGVVRLGELSGEIWEDSNGDGVQDAQEKLLEGVTVHLMNGTGRTILDTVATDEN